MKLGTGALVNFRTGNTQCLVTLVIFSFIFIFISNFMYIGICGSMLAVVVNSSLSYFFKDFCCLCFILMWRWRDESVVICTICSSRGFGFNSQHLHGDSQPSGILVPRDLTQLLYVARKPGTHMSHIHSCTQNTHT